MASRHPIPLLRSSDVGADDQAVVPRFLEPVEIEFQAGKSLEDFMGVVKGSKNIRVSAAAGSGKSVRMPTEVAKALGGVVVHCTPSLLLATSLHDYVSSVSKGDVSYALVTEVLDEYPDSGIVYTSSATFVAQCCRWRSLGLEPGVTLYMDECHESDAGTVVIRDLKHTLPGVARYLEASATYGSGDSKSPYTAARLPSVVTERRYNLPPAKDWDVDASGVPWSMRRLQGDMIIFVEDEAEASILHNKFMLAGCKVYRMGGHTTPDQYRAVVANMAQNAQSGMVSVLVLDYTFRSGFTFPTVVRIVDFARVRFWKSVGGRAVAEYRNAYSNEVYQTKNRGGRVAGRACDYFRPNFDPDNVVVFAEGVEAELACVWKRMLGRHVGSIYSGVKFAVGKVPAQLVKVMRGVNPLSCYASDQEWPGKSACVVPVEEQPLLDPPSPSVVSVSSGASYERVSAVAARPPSVFSVADEVETVMGMSDREFRELHRKSVQAKVRHDSPPPPMPKINNGVAQAPAVVQGLADLHTMFTGLDLGGVSLVAGKFYVATGDWGQGRARMFADGISGVHNAAKGKSIQNFIASLSRERRDEALTVALLECNRATVVLQGATIVTTKVKECFDKLKVFDGEAFKEWLSLVRDVCVGSQATIDMCFRVLDCAPRGSLAEAPDSDRAADVASYVKVLLSALRVCADMDSEPPALEGAGLPVAPEHLAQVTEYAQSYGGLSGRMNIRVNGRGFRARVMNACLRGGSVEADVSMG